MYTEIKATSFSFLFPGEHGEIGSSRNIMTSYCLFTTPTSRMLNCSTEIGGDFSLRWDPKNGKLELSITLVDTIVINVWVLYWQVCAEKGASAMNLKAFRIDFACAN